MGRRRRGARLLTALGVLMMLAGAAVGGYLAWEFWGSTVVAHRDQQRIVADLESGWSDQVASVPVAGTQATAIVRIPRFGSDYAVPLLGSVEDDALAAGIGHFPQTAGPGGVGNFAVAGHRITHGEPFRDLPELEPGDRVVVETRGWRYTYVLDTAGDDLVVPFTQSWVLAEHPRNPVAGGVQPPRGAGRRLITLTTCAELFHTDDRSVVFGHLLDRAPRVPSRADQ